MHLNAENTTTDGGNIAYNFACIVGVFSIFTMSQ